MTFDFVGTGGEVCIWVDPEVAYWSQALSPQPSQIDRKWAFPDNTFDDGDIDLFAGQSVYYTGSPGETIGDFVGRLRGQPRQRDPDSARGLSEPGRPGG